MKGDLRLQYNLTSEKNIKYLSGSVDLKRDFDELYDVSFHRQKKVN